MILLSGRNTALLEGLAQSLGRLGEVRVAEALVDADELHGLVRPTLLVVAREALAAGTSRNPNLRSLVGGLPAVVAYHEAGDATPLTSLPPDVSRVVLADLELPLERHRLLALAEHLAGRARDRGTTPGTPPVQPESPSA